LKQTLGTSMPPLAVQPAGSLNPLLPVSTHSRCMFAEANPAPCMRHG
jgi:hypothetical protein